MQIQNNSALYLLNKKTVNSSTNKNFLNTECKVPNLLSAEPKQTNVINSKLLKVYFAGVGIKNLQLSKAILQSKKFNINGYIPETEKIVDGFKLYNIANASELDKKGFPLKETETILVDRSKDTKLNEIIHDYKIKFNEWKDSSIKSQLKNTLDYVNNLFEKSPKESCEIVNSIKEEKLLGDFVKLGAGICRHRALLLKILADEAGLNTSLIKGSLDAGGHVWNECSSESNKYILDTVNGICQPLSSMLTYKKIKYNNTEGVPVYSTEDVKSVMKKIVNLTPGQKLTIGTVGDTETLTCNKKIKDFNPIAEIKWDEDLKCILRYISDDPGKVSESGINGKGNLSLNDEIELKNAALIFIGKKIVNPILNLEQPRYLISINKIKMYDNLRDKVINKKPVCPETLEIISKPDFKDKWISFVKECNDFLNK